MNMPQPLCRLYFCWFSSKQNEIKFYQNQSIKICSNQINIWNVHIVCECLGIGYICNYIDDWSESAKKTQQKQLKTKQCKGNKWKQINNDDMLICFLFAGFKVNTQINLLFLSFSAECLASSYIWYAGCSPLTVRQQAVILRKSGVFPMDNIFIGKRLHRSSPCHIYGSPNKSSKKNKLYLYWLSMVFWRRSYTYMLKLLNLVNSRQQSRPICRCWVALAQINIPNGWNRC